MQCPFDGVDLCRAKKGRWSDGCISGVGGFKIRPDIRVERFEEWFDRFAWCITGFGLCIQRSGVGAVFGASSVNALGSIMGIGDSCLGSDG
jgi:hypothetical protein